jgi:hypothetical protein
VIDHKIKYVGVSKLRKMNSQFLREMDSMFVLQVNDEPISILIRYDEFMKMQDYLLVGVGLDVADAATGER